jgi:hypothetical protein
MDFSEVFATERLDARWLYSQADAACLKLFG